jgi:ribulose-phosphate 3-epimerase
MNKEIQIIPAIIPESFEYLQNVLASLKGKVSRVQIDVTDGKYTPNTSWPYQTKVDRDFEKIVSQDAGMPYWEDFNFDIDLMISNPEEEYQKWVDAGASALIFHLESLSGDKLEFIKRVKEENFIQIAVAIQTKTPNEELEPFLDIVDFVQFMGIEKIGYQGQEFAEDVLGKIRDLRKIRPDLDIAVDGSVNFDTADRIADQGANLLVSGSAILRAEDIGEALEDMKKMTE